MFQNQKLEELYHLAVQRDASHTMDAYLFLLEKVNHLTDKELELIELATNMYTDIHSVSRGVTEFIRSIVQYNITNINEIIQILRPYHKCMQERKLLNQPISFKISHELSTEGLSSECIENRGRLCTLRIFLVQLSSNLALTNEYMNFCIHSNVFDHIAKNSIQSNTDFLQNIVIDLSKCETATVGYLCEYWLHTEIKKGRIIPSPQLKQRVDYFCSYVENGISQK